MKRWICRLALAAAVLLTALAAQAQPANRDALFTHRVDGRSVPEKWLNAVDIRTRDVGRSFALIVGVWDYPNMPVGSRTLEPAQWDVVQLTKYLKEHEYFDEIVVLANRNFTEENLRYFLQDYFPAQIANAPGSRFLFAFSGHGFNVERDGFLLHPGARSFTDERNSLAMSALNTFLRSVIRTNAKVGVFINACSSGDFVTAQFGDSNFVFQHPGAHAITASSQGQKSLALSSVGKGSVFFEALLLGLTKGYADSYPPAREAARKGDPPLAAGDGIVVMREAFTYLEPEVTRLTNGLQLPKFGDLRQSNHLGSFYFFNQRVQVARNGAPIWDPGTVTAMGGLNPEITGLRGPTPVAVAPPPGLERERLTPSPESTPDRPPSSPPVRAFLVFFDFDRTNLTAPAMATIRQAATDFTAQGLTMIEVIGHSDTSQSTAISNAESSRRAEAVKAALITFGIPAHAIVTRGRGKTQLLVPTADGVREPQNRRAEILLR